MTWVKTPIRFDRRAMNLILPDEVDYQITDVDHLEQEVYKLILQHRPELAGCLLVAINFDVYQARLIATIQHVSLSQVQPGQMLPMELLVPPLNSHVVVGT